MTKPFDYSKLTENIRETARIAAEELRGYETARKRDAIDHETIRKRFAEEQVVHALKAGAALNRVKAVLEHGEWGKWLKAECSLYLAANGRELSECSVSLRRQNQNGFEFEAEDDRPECAPSHMSKEASLDGLFDHAKMTEPRLKGHSDHLIGHFLAKQGCKSCRVHSGARRGWEFPSLSEVRAKWEKRFPAWQWDDPKMSDWSGPSM